MSHNSGERKLFQRIRDSINRHIFTGEVASKNELDFLHMIVGADTGRRVFYYTLKQFVQAGKKSLIEITPEAFVLLVEIIQKTLDILELTNGADYICGKVLLSICKSLFKKSPHGKRDLLQGSIMSHYAWQNLFFWEEYFWDVVSETIPWTLYPGQDVSYTKEQKLQLHKQMKSFADTMVGWGNLPPAAIQLFLSNIARDMQFDDDSTMGKLNLYVDKKDAQFKRNSGAGTRRSAKRLNPKPNKVTVSSDDKAKEKEKEKKEKDKDKEKVKDKKLQSQSSPQITTPPHKRNSAPRGTHGREKSDDNGILLSSTASKRGFFAESKNKPLISPRPQDD